MVAGGRGEYVVRISKPEKKKTFENSSGTKEAIEKVRVILGLRLGQVQSHACNSIHVILHAYALWVEHAFLACT